MLPIAKCKLNDDEIKRYESGEPLHILVHDIACRSAFHPAGYGFYGDERIVKTDDGYFAHWTRGTHCD